LKSTGYLGGLKGLWAHLTASVFIGSTWSQDKHRKTGAAFSPVEFISFPQAGQRGRAIEIS
jgi:hypothetical protein